MEKEDRIYKAMIDRTVGLYEENQAIFDTKPLLQQYFTETTVSRNAMQLAIQSQSGGSTKGTTEDLKNQKILVATLAFAVVQKARPYAKTKTNELLEKVDFSLSEFKGYAHEEFPGKLRNFTQAVREELPGLALYEVTEPELALIETGVDSFEAMNTGRDMKGNDREQATANIPKYRKQAMVSLKLLDDLVPALLGTSHPDLVSKYRGLRELVG